MACPKSNKHLGSSWIEKRHWERVATANRAFSNNEASHLNDGKYNKKLIPRCVMRTTSPGPAIFLFLIAALVLLFGCDRRQQSSSPGVQEVAVMTVQPQELNLTTELPGRTAAYLVSEIRPQVNGIIRKRQSTEGADVNLP